MKKFYLLAIVLFVIGRMAVAQSPADIYWTKCLGGSDDDEAKSIQQTYNGQFISAGRTSSINGDVHGNHGGYDLWVVKQKRLGDTVWAKCFGGTNTDYANSIQQTFDGGFITAGSSYSNNGDVHGNHGDSDFWVVRLANNGDTLWTKTLGGSDRDHAHSIQQTYDSGFIIAGSTKSINGDVSGLHGDFDFWVVKLNSNGDTSWTKCLGGTGSDQASSIHQTYDSGYIVLGSSESNDGDVHGNNGGTDYWIAKLNSLGDTLWTKSFGGSDYDYAGSVQQTLDSGFIVAGYTYSNDGDVYGNHGGYDYWILRLDNLGDTIWTKTLGGTDHDFAYSIQQTFDSGFVVAGYSNSTDGDVHGNNGSYDFWVAKLYNHGDTAWTSCYGGSGSEVAHSIQQTTDSNYIIAGSTRSPDNGDVHGKHGSPGSMDSWIVRLGANIVSCPAPSLQTASNITLTSAELGWTENGDATTWQIMLDTAGFDTSAYTHTTVLSNPYTWNGLSVFTAYDWYVRSVCGDGDTSSWVGPHAFTTLATCPAPSAQSAGNITTTSADLSWTENGSATSWQIILGNEGFDTTGVTPVVVTSNPYTYTGLTLLTSYEWYVQADCGGGDQSIWIGPDSFSTTSDTMPVPFIEDFASDTLPYSWYLPGTNDWNFSTDADDGAAGAGDHTPGGGTNYAWAEAPAWDTLYTPVIDVSSITRPSLEFWYFFNNTSVNGDAWLEVALWNGAIWDTIFSSWDDDPNWRYKSIDLSPYSINDFVQFRFMAHCDPVSGGNGDVLIDDILVDGYPIPPGTFWALNYGGTASDGAYSIQQTFDSGYVVAGGTQSINWDVHGNHGSDDFWIIRLDKDGDTLWTKCLGGTSVDVAQSIQQTYDSGYIVAGYTMSYDGDIHLNQGATDFWIVKIDMNGDTSWTKTYGGSEYDNAYSVQQTYDSGYIVAGNSVSSDGDVHGNHGSSDFWILKLDDIGDTLWTKCLGGSSGDEAYSIQQTYDSGYIVAGYTYSNNGDVHGNHGGSDFWIVKLNNLGDTLWTKSLGGTDGEESYSIQQTYDSGFVVAGYAQSTDGDVHGNHSPGIDDYWVVKLNDTGDTIWTKTLGGGYFDDARSVQQTFDSGYIVAGYVYYTNDGDVHGNHGGYDYWVVKLNRDGDTLWTRCLGGTSDEQAFSIQQTSNKTYVVAGSASSNDGDVYSVHGNTDFWIVELAEFPNHIYQTIPLLSGWNILSFNVTPNDSNMLHIVQPLIDSAELVKVQDESGGIIQNIPGTGWMNTIGNMANTEGYYSKVNANTQLKTSGLPVALPYTIPFTTGWNIMGYPLQQSQDALTAVQPLINDDELIKVLDESGGFIQDIPGIGWMNTIGDFEAGEGYYIKVTDNTSLTLDNPPVLFIGSPPIVQKQPQLYTVPKANPYLPMNIIVTGINIEGYTPQNDDEVAVFDNNRLTGAGVIITGNKALTSFATAMDDPTTTEIDGYLKGNIPAFQFKSANLTGSIQLTAKPVFGDLRFSPLGTLVCTLEGSLTAIEQKEEKTFVLKCVPNPANNYTNIQYQLPEEGQLQLEVFDLSSHRIAVLQNEQQSEGSHHYRFDATLLERGIYLIKIQLRTQDNQYTEVVKFVRN